MKVARITSVPLAFVHILRQLQYIEEKGHELHLVSSEGDYWKTVREYAKGPSHRIDIPREISLRRDLVALWKLYRLFRREHFDLVHSTTPKAGLLTALAAFFARVPIRLHTFTGQRWATLRGPMRGLLRLLDRLIVTLNTRVYADSRSQADFLIHEGITPRKKIAVLGEGSLGGINTARFSPGRYDHEKEKIEHDLHLSPNALRLIFVGRVTRDKGIVELVSAFTTLVNQGENLELILVGPFEPHLDPLPDATVDAIRTHERIHAVGLYPNPEHYLSLAHAFVMPSYREGFGTVVLEANAMGLPSIGTKIPGLVDAVQDGKTGCLVPVRSVEDLCDVIREWIRHPERIREMGEAGRIRVLRDFDADVLARQLLDEYAQF